MDRPFDIEGLVRPNIRDLSPYSSARDEYAGSASVFLDANENPFSAPLNRYPDPGQKELKEKLARLKQVRPDQIFLGNGSDEAIDLLFRIFCEPGRDNVITVDPTYGMYAVCADINNVARKSVTLNSDFSLDSRPVLEAVDENTRLIFLCSPNNPTSNALGREALMEIIDGAPCLVVVDEAYIDFSAENGLLEFLDKKPNLVILQTLSKAWALAGIRTGMAFAHPGIIAYMSAVKYPYNLNTLSIEKAIESLEDTSGRDGQVEIILQEREKLADELALLDFVEEVHPSDANFLLVRTSDPSGIYAFLKKEGIIVRDRSGIPLCGGCLRITVGTPEENRSLLSALKCYEKKS